MRKATMIVAAVAAGVLGTGAVVTPVVLAAGEDQTVQRPGPGWHEDAPGRGPGGGPGMREESPARLGEGRYGMDRDRWSGNAPADCPGLAEKGTLTRDQKQRLADQAVLEKISHDVYVAFATDTGDRRFERVARAETRHLDAVRALLGRYGVADPTKGMDAGEFPGEAQKAYQAYVEQGSGSLQAALGTARKIEQADIAELKHAAEGLGAPDVAQVYEHLVRASEMHLDAFSR